MKSTSYLNDRLRRIGTFCLGLFTLFNPIEILGEGCEEKLAVLVDGYSSGKLFPMELARRGYHILHMQTSEKIPDIFVPSFRGDNFDENFIHDPKNPDATYDWLKLRNPRLFFQGTETGTVWVDLFNHRLGRPANGNGEAPDRNPRRDKAAIVEAVSEAGLRAARQLRSRDLDEVVAWHKKEVQTWPLVLKPPASAGSDIKVARNYKQLKRHFNWMLGRENLMGLENHHIVVQEFVTGTEYIVEMVSVGGRHHLAYIAQYEAREVPGHNSLFTAIRVLPRGHPIEKTILPYANGVLDAVKIRQGPSHMEVKIDPSFARPVCIIEVASRMAGMDFPRWVQLGTGINEVAAAVSAFEGAPDSEVAEFLAPEEQPQNVMTVLIHSLKRGKMSHALIPAVKALPSYRHSSWHYGDGASMPRSTNLLNLIGDVVLIHPDPAQLERDHQQIREWELAGAFHQ